MIKMITSDMDGTLLAGKEWATRHLPHDFGEALDELDRRGIHFLAASGRTYPSVRSNFGEFADRIDYICDNGGCLVHRGEVVQKEIIPHETMLKVLEVAAAIPNCRVNLCSERGTFQSFDEKWPGAEKERPFTFIVPDLREVTEPLTKLSMAGAFDSFVLTPKLEAVLGEELTFLKSGRNFIDIMKKGVNKGSGIRFFRSLWGITREECMSFGDEYNDLEQFDESEWSFAMGNAPDPIKAYAHYVTDTNENDGVTKAIWKYALGRER